MLIQIQQGPASHTFPVSPPPEFHLFATELGDHLLMVNGSRIFSVPPELAEQLRAPGAPASAILEAYGLSAEPYVRDEPLHDPPLRAISLAIAQSCNLGCVYCYAQEGSFGGQAQAMSRTVALDSIALLLSEANLGDAVQVTYLGGEPLGNRALLRESAEYAATLAKAKGVEVRFSITTNGTLLTPDDGAFFEQYGFAVTISLDGTAEVHDRLRPMKNGQGSYQRTMERLRSLLDMQQRMQVSARVTVTPSNLTMRETLDALIDAGFHSVGFSPMLSSPTGRAEMGAEELQQMLKGMIACGQEFETRLLQGRRYPFLNLVNALREMHKGTHRPYPCGAGAGYLGVSADGDLFACHRFVGDDSGTMGSLSSGIDRTLRNTWLAERHVHLQEPCRGCWARYQCGGGCHHEVIHRGRPACDYIRGWLDYCMQAYVRTLHRCPEYFGVRERHDR